MCNPSLPPSSDSQPDGGAGRNILVIYWTLLHVNSTVVIYCTAVYMHPGPLYCTARCFTTLHCTARTQVHYTSYM